MLLSQTVKSTSQATEAEAAQQPQADEASTSGGNSGAIDTYRRKCYIKSIAPNVSPSQLRGLLEPCGRIVDFTMPEDRRIQQHKVMPCASNESTSGHVKLSSALPAKLK